MYKLPLLLIGVGVLLLFGSELREIVLGVVSILIGIGLGVWRFYTSENSIIQSKIDSRDLASLVGKSGQAITPLRPGGFVSIDSKRIDAVSQGEFIEAGTAVEVVDVQSINVVVRRLN